MTQTYINVRIFRTYVVSLNNFFSVILYICYVIHGSLGFMNCFVFQVKLGEFVSSEDVS